MLIDENTKLDTICACGWKGPEASLKYGNSHSDEGTNFEIFVKRHCPQCDYCFGTYADDRYAHKDDGLSGCIYDHQHGDKSQCQSHSL